MEKPETPSGPVVITDRRGWLSPALIIQAAVLVIGGLAVYWSTISEIRAALAVGRVRDDEATKDIIDLHRQLLELDRKLHEHDELTRKAHPALGRKTELPPFSPSEGG